MCVWGGLGEGKGPGWSVPRTLSASTGWAFTVCSYGAQTPHLLGPPLTLGSNSAAPCPRVPATQVPELAGAWGCQLPMAGASRRPAGTSQHPPQLREGEGEGPCGVTAGVGGGAGGTAVPCPVVLTAEARFSSGSRRLTRYGSGGNSPAPGAPLKSPGQAQGATVGEAR